MWSVSSGIAPGVCGAADRRRKQPIRESWGHPQPGRRLLSASGPDAGRHVLLSAVVLCAMAAGVHDSHLFGVDEPREAEIARETLEDGHWVTPHLCGLPFLEKPPLYYNVVATAYRLTGSIRPWVARSVSALFAVVMVTAVFVFAYRRAGPRAAWLSSLVLLAMPQFYRYSHTIVLDIAVGAFCTVALVAFSVWAFRPGPSRESGLLYLFYLATAGAFLTKGLIGAFHVVLIVGAFVLLRRRFDLLKGLFSPAPILISLIPVVVWIYLYYREGGIGYLHEHFINNTIGRALHIHFAVPGATFHHTDLGNQEPWHFYLSSLPRMIGIALAALPLALWDEGKAIRSLGRSVRRRCRPEADLRVLLILWAVLPPLVLSFSSIKETSYVLPSYSAIAVLAGCWADRRLREAECDGWSGAGWLMFIVPFAATNLLLPDGPVRPYLLLTVASLVAAAILAAFLFARNRFVPATFLTLAVALSAVIVYHSPRVLLHRNGCYLAFGRQVWERVGEARLFLYRPNDRLRGAIPFSANRLAREIDTPEQLSAVFASRDVVCVLMGEALYHDAQMTSVLPLGNPRATLFDRQANRNFVLLSNGHDQDVPGSRSGLQCP